MKDNEINRALEILSSGGVIVYPTETVWGIGCDATNESAVDRIYKIKKRTDAKSMLTLVDNENRLPSYVDQVPDMAWDLIEMSTKPLTIIYPKGKNLAPNLLAEDGSIGIRVTNHPFCKQLINQLRKPIVSTSANVSGEKSPASFDEISPKILDKVDLVVHPSHEGKNAGIPSGIIKLGLDGQVKVIRG